MRRMLQDYRLRCVRGKLSPLTVVCSTREDRGCGGPMSGCEGQFTTVVIAAKDVVAPEGATPRVAMVAGASGLTGRALLQLLLQDNTFSRVLALSRRPLTLEHRKLANRIMKFDALAAGLKGQRCTDAFCTLGAAGGPAAAEAQLQRVDLQLVVEFARAAQAAGATRFVVVSAAGASVTAPQPFLRVKGEMENALRELKFIGLDIMQPGVVFGARSDDGLGATLRHGLLAVASPLLRRSKGGINAISGDDLAAAMLGAARTQRRGPWAYTGETLLALARTGQRPA